MIKSISSLLTACYSAPSMLNDLVGLSNFSPSTFKESMSLSISIWLRSSLTVFLRAPFSSVDEDDYESLLLSGGIKEVSIVR
jgi:hypothetical protein